ncbi:MAG: PRD domain-containing protein [Faecalibacterium sp.]
MKIVKKINNNVALAQDAKGHELVVFGKGIGFPATPYELDDLSRIQRTFYDVGTKNLALLKDIPDDVFLAADAIAEDAADELDCPLNPNLPFVLADHLSFAIQRSREGIVLRTPLAYDVRHLYPAEYQLGRRALTILKERLGIQLPEEEAVSITLHLINAEAEVDDVHRTMTAARIISEIGSRVEQYFDLQLDRESFSYSRFMMHLRYLVQRMMCGKSTAMANSSHELFCAVRREYPEIYACVQTLVEYFQKEWQWNCTEDEQLYLMMHIHRVTTASQHGG